MLVEMQKCIGKALGMNALKLITLSAILSLSANALAANKSTPNVAFRVAYIEGVGTSNSFIIHENEMGFQELQGLFLGAFSTSKSIEKCCTFTASKQISLLLRESFFVSLGETNMLIEEINLVWPVGKNMEPVMVLNKTFVLHPNIENSSYSLLLTWAKKRGFS